MTIKEISLITGLSPATISRALSKPNLVKSYTKERIMQAINEKNNSFLKELNILVPDTSSFPSNDIINHIVDYLCDEEVEIVLYSSKNDLNLENRIIERINSKKNNNAVLFWFPIEYERKKDFIYPSIPTIVLYHNFYVNKSNSNVLYINFSKLVEMTASLLYKGGAQKLLILINHDENSYPGNNIKRLYIDYITAYCPLLNKSEFLFFPNNNWNDVYHLLNQKYNNNFPFDSIISLSSSIAYGVVTFLKIKKLSIPNDVSIITFGYDLGFELMAQPISMIYPDIQKAAEHIIYMATQLIENNDYSESINLNLQSTLLGSERKY